MSAVLETYKDKGFGDKLSEVYEVVQTVEVVTSGRQTVRIEVLKDYAHNPYSYEAKYWKLKSVQLQSSEREEDKFKHPPEDKWILCDAPEYGSANGRDPDIVLLQALGFVTGK